MRRYQTIGPILILAILLSSSVMQVRADAPTIGIHVGDVFRYRIVNPWTVPQIAPFTAIATIEVISIEYPRITCRITLNMQNGTFLELKNPDGYPYEDISIPYSSLLSAFVFFPANTPAGSFDWYWRNLNVHTKKEYGKTVDWANITATIAGEDYYLYLEWFQDTGVPILVKYHVPVPTEYGYLTGSYTLLNKCDSKW